MQQSEIHPFTPYIPEGARILMLGTFPPKQERWSIPFYYPNWINDMWRIMGLIFYGDKEHFCDTPNRTFRLDDIKEFLDTRGIALHDTAAEVCRLKDNASDKWLEIRRPIDLQAFLDKMPGLHAVVTTGEKAASVVASLTATPLPAVGTSEECVVAGRHFRHYRMPSTSRAYPMNIAKKAEFYARMFEECGYIINAAAMSAATSNTK